MPKRILPHNHGQNLEILLERIPESEEMRCVADYFKEISDVSRLRVFWLLCHCEECVSNVSAMMDMLQVLLFPAERGKRSIIARQIRGLQSSCTV